MAAFELCFSSRKEFLKKEVIREIAFKSISLFHVQEHTSRSTTMRAFVFLAKFAEFYYHKTSKHLKQEVNDDLSVCVDEHSSSGLSVTGDIPLSYCPNLITVTLTLLSPMKKCPINFYHGVAFTAQI